MRQTYEVDFEDGSTIEIKIDQRDIRKWESQYDMSYLTTPTSYTVTTQLIYIAGCRDSWFKERFPTYEDFDKVAETVQSKGLDERPNPTPPEATDDSSVP